jgi:serine/threonine protein kinase
MSSSLANYEMTDECLGEGSYAAVYRGVRRSDGLHIAIKRVSIFDMSPDERKKTAQEAKILSNFEHPNVIRWSVPASSFFFAALLIRTTIVARAPVCSAGARAHKVVHLKLWHRVLSGGAAFPPVEKCRGD